MRVAYNIKGAFMPVLRKSVLHGGALLALMTSSSGYALASANCHGATHTTSPANCVYSAMPPRATADSAAVSEAYRTIISDGTYANVTGVINFDTGTSGFQGEMTIDAINAIVPVTFSYNDPSLPPPATILSDAYTIDLGIQNNTISYYDEILGEFRNLNVYDTAAFVDQALGQSRVMSYVAVDQDQYIGLNIGTVDGTGGVLDIQADFQNSGGSVGDMHLSAKNSTLFFADGSQGAESKIIWNAPTATTINMNAASTDGDNHADVNVMVVGWPTSVTIDILNAPAEVFVINDFADFQAFNNKLINYIENGIITPDPARYSRYINDGLNLKPVVVNYEKQVAGSPLPDDKIFIAPGTKAIMRATGADASIEIASGSAIGTRNASGAVLLQEGATGTNDGTVTAFWSSGMTLTTSAASGKKSSATNNHIINALERGTGVAVNNSDFVNSSTGIINVDISVGEESSNGIALSNGSTGVNDGFINLGANGNTTTALQGSSRGVSVSNSYFTNNGQIYIGRARQNAASDILGDVLIQSAEAVTGIHVSGTSAVVNNGNIIIGSLSDGIDAITVSNTKTASVTNSGTITILGNTNRNRINHGVYVLNSGFRNDVGGAVTNSINLDSNSKVLLKGGNATGLRVMADGAGETASAGMGGLIDIEGSVSPTSGTRSHGIWAEGRNGGEAIVDMTGHINLLGQGAIGVHARGKATINVSVDGQIDFDTGSYQIGYFTFGADSRVNVLRNILSVDTSHSTLFRIEDGSTFDGQNYQISVNGNNAVGVLGTGIGTITDVKGGTYYVNGLDSVGVRVEGGAKGWIYDNTVININAAGAKGMVVDGDKYLITGARYAQDVAGTVAHTAATMNSNINNAIGFTVMNNALLNYKPSDELMPSPLSGHSSLNLGRIHMNMTGMNSVGFQGAQISNFDISGLDAYVNGWMLDLSDAAHDVKINNSRLLAVDGFLKNATNATNSIANIDIDGSWIEGRITTDNNSITNVNQDDKSIWMKAAATNITDFEHSGLVNMQGGTPTDRFTQFHASGNYIGYAGNSFYMDVMLDDGVNPEGDLLVFGTTAGESTLYVRNAGGMGRKTIGDGIKIIDVGTFVDSNGAFALGERVFAGAYEYELFKNGIALLDGDWYLRSTGLRPEVPIYSMAQSMLSTYNMEMLGTYRDRIGFIDAGDQRAWGRVFGSFGNMRQKRSDPLTNAQNFFEHGSSYTFDMGGFQAGFNLIDSKEQDEAKNKAGLFVGAGHSVGKVHHVTEGHAGKLKVTPYTVGAYWTHLANNDALYIDAVTAATYYDIDSSTVLDRTDSTHAMGYTASLEAGYNIPLTEDKSWGVEPEMQVIYQYTDIKNITDYAGRIDFENTNSLFGRVGARLVTEQVLTGKEPVKAWIRADYWQDFTSRTHTNFKTMDGDPSVRVNNKLRGSWGQVGLGVSGNVTNNISMFVSGDYNKGLEDEKYHSWDGRIGLTYKW